MILPSPTLRWQLKRPPVARPDERAAQAFVCPACDVLLCDGVVYTYCPACDLPVDWVDPRSSVWCCATCDAMVNEQRTDTPFCEPCGRVLLCIHEGGDLATVAAAATAAEAPRTVTDRFLEGLGTTVLFAVLLLATIGPLLGLALDPEWRRYALAIAAPWLLVPLIMAGAFIGSLGSSMQELRDLVRDPVVRVLHGLEHATAKVLEQGGHEICGGFTQADSFVLRVRRQPGVRQERVMRLAVREAIRRVGSGERSLAYHPKCGTSLLVTATLVALVALAAGGIGLLMTVSLHALLIMAGLFLLLILAGARPLGLLTQRYLTVSTDFCTATVGRMECSALDDLLSYRVYLRVER